MIHRRLVINFPDLNETEEKVISDDIIEFIIYYSRYVAIDKQRYAATVVNYYCRNSIKPASVEGDVIVTKDRRVSREEYRRGRGVSDEKS